MSNQNHFFVGNLTRDPESRTTTNGNTVANFSVAVNGKSPEDTVYFECETWGKTAELLMKYFTKGKSIVVLDSIARTDTWEKDGEKRSRLKFVVNRLGFAPSSKGDESPATETPSPKKDKEKAKPKEKVVTKPVDDDEDDDDGIPF